MTTNTDDYFYYVKRDIFFNLMNNFINNGISVNDFVFTFTELNTYCAELTWSNSQFFNKEDLPLDKFKGFALFIQDVSLQCEFFVADPTVREDGEVSEYELRMSVSKNLIEIGKYLE